MTRIRFTPLNPAVGDRLELEAVPDIKGAYSYHWTVTNAAGGVVTDQQNQQAFTSLSTDMLPPGDYTVRVRLGAVGEGAVGQDDQQDIVTITLDAPAPPATVPVTMQRTSAVPTNDIALWATIRHNARVLSFDSYARGMDWLLCGSDVNEEGNRRRAEVGNLLRGRVLPFGDTAAYQFLRLATEVFFLANVQSLEDINLTRRDVEEVRVRLGIPVDRGELNRRWQDYLEPLDTLEGDQIRTLPYLALIRRKLSDQEIRNSVFALMHDGDDVLPEACHGILARRLSSPLLISLIWSYWHEEGMLVQSLNQISRRFQNIRSPANHDPLANLEIDPLRPLNNLLWGYVQDEQHRLSVRRRAYEYDHHYGFSLQGRAIGPLRTADSRSKFLEAFHSLLYLTTLFYRQDDDTTVIADAFPLLNALRDVHLILSQGAHNQFGDLPSTARQEMLIQQWLLARPEFREFLPTRLMVAYPEPWMDRVDAMKSIQGWTDTSVLHFHTLAVAGEQLLLSVRYGNWSVPNAGAQQAANWARFWRQEVQEYIYAYRTATGVDLNAELNDPASATDRYLPPSLHLQRQLERQKRGVLPPARSPAVFQESRVRGRLPR